MVLFVMSDFVRQHAHDFLRGQLFHQRVVEHHALAAAESREVGVRLAAALGRINDVDIVELEVHPRGESFDGRTELPFRQRRLLVEQRHDELRVEVLHEQREEGHGAPGDEPEPARRERVDPRAERQDGAHDHDVQQKAFQRVRREQLRRGTVEAEPLLDHEGPVDVEGQRNHPGDQVEDAPENERLHDGRTAHGAGSAVEGRKAAEGEDGQRDQGAHQAGDQGELAVRHRIVLLLAVAVFVVEVLQKVRNRPVRSLDIEQGQPGGIDEFRQDDRNDQPV